MGPGGLVGLVGLVSLLQLMGLAGLGCQVWPILGIFLMIQMNSMIPKSSKIQREFQLEVWTMIIQKSTCIPLKVEVCWIF